MTSAPSQSTTSATSAEDRARASRGTSMDVIYRRVVEEIRRRGASGTVYDIGCGTGALRSFLPEESKVGGYVGIDIVRYDAFPSDAAFIPAALDQCPWPLADGCSEITCCVETIEHLENPRTLFRELTRITRPGGLVIVTTPNNLAMLSLITLATKGVFNSFQQAPGLYPSHITALLPVDLQRIATECRLINPTIAFTNAGRIPGLAARWPAKLGMRGQFFSDNVLLVAQKASATSL